jgi:hypothetical protein
VEFIIASKSKKIAVECSSRKPRLRRLTTTLTTPLDIHKTNMHQLTANSPIINTPRNTVKKPRSALNAHEDLPTLATNPPDQVQTHKMGLDMAMVERRRYKEYEEDVEYKEYEEFNTDRNIAKRHITSAATPAPFLKLLCWMCWRNSPWRRSSSMWTIPPRSPRRTQSSHHLHKEVQLTAAQLTVAQLPASLKRLLGSSHQLTVAQQSSHQPHQDPQ